MSQPQSYNPLDQWVGERAGQWQLHRPFGCFVSRQLPLQFGNHLGSRVYADVVRISRKMHDIFAVDFVGWHCVAYRLACLRQQRTDLGTYLVQNHL